MLVTVSQEPFWAWSFMTRVREASRLDGGGEGRVDTKSPPLHKPQGWATPRPSGSTSGQLVNCNSVLDTVPTTRRVFEILDAGSSYTRSRFSIGFTKWNWLRLITSARFLRHSDCRVVGWLPSYRGKSGAGGSFRPERCFARASHKACTEALCPRPRPSLDHHYLFFCPARHRH